MIYKELQYQIPITAAGEGVPVFCEGRVHTPEDARAAMEAGAFAVVVGTAITHPTSITGWFAKAVEGR